MLGILALGASANPACAQAPRYLFENLGVSSGFQRGFGMAINSFGVVAGYSDTGSLDTKVFRTGVTGDVNTPPGNDLGNFGSATFVIAKGVNDSGQVVGQDGSNHAFKTPANGFITDPGAGIGTGQANGVNNAGQVTGASSSGTTQAYRLTGAQHIGDAGTALGFASGYTTSSVGVGINASGQIAGYSVRANGDAVAIRTSVAGDFADPTANLGVPGGFVSSRGQAINASGQVAGYVNAAGGPANAFVTTATGNLSTATLLGTLGGTMSNALGINDVGTVVGVSTTAAAAQHAFVFYNGLLYDLNNQIDNLPAGYVLDTATSINANGQITGWGRLNGVQTVFRLTQSQTPEPGVWAMGLACLSAGFLTRRRRR